MRLIKFVPGFSADTVGDISQGQEITFVGGVDEYVPRGAKTFAAVHFGKRDGCNQAVGLFDIGGIMAFDKGDVRFALNHFFGEFFKDAGFVFAVGVTGFAGQTGGVLRRVFAIGAAIVIEDSLAHFIVDG